MRQNNFDFDNASNGTTDHQRFKRGRSRINHIVDPSSVYPVEQLLRIEKLTALNLPDYIGSLKDKSSANAKKTLDFLAGFDLIANQRECSDCHGYMSLHKDVSAKHSQYYWKCPDCRNQNLIKKTTVRKNSFFEGLRLTVQQVLFLAAEWIDNPHKTVKTLAEAFKVNKNTISEVHEWFRDLTQQWWIRTVDENGGAKLGGQGKIVEIDETAMFRAKYKRGSMLNRPTIWVFGLIERGTNKVAMFQVHKRDAHTLLPIIQRHVLPGTTIMSDGWGAYNSISALEEAYKHSVINHKLHFVDPNDETIHTQSVEASWRALKMTLKHRYGERDYLLQGHLCNYLFRRFNKDDKILNRLIVEMKCYNRNQNSLLPRDFEKNYPPEDEELEMEDDDDWLLRQIDDDLEDDNRGYDDMEDDNRGYDDMEDDNRGYDDMEEDNRGYDDMEDDNRGYDDMEDENHGYGDLEDENERLDESENNEVENGKDISDDMMDENNDEICQMKFRSHIHSKIHENGYTASQRSLHHVTHKENNLQALVLQKPLRLSERLFYSENLVAL